MGQAYGWVVLHNARHAEKYNDPVYCGLLIVLAVAVIIIGWKLRTSES